MLFFFELNNNSSERYSVRTHWKVNPDKSNYSENLHMFILLFMYPCSVVLCIYQQIGCFQNLFLKLILFSSIYNFGIILIYT